MKIIRKKNPNSFINVDEYIDTIFLKCKNKMIINKKQTKINDDNIIIPTIENYNDITKYNYNISQLKTNPLLLFPVLSFNNLSLAKS